MKRIAIIGGGISGLVTAYRLSQSRMGQEGDLEIHIYEASDRCGGVIQTQKQEGLLMELGPDSFLSSKPGMIELCQELGLDNNFMATNPNFRQSFILSKDMLIPVPRGFYLMGPTKVSDAIRTPLLSSMGKIRMAFELFIPPKIQEGDESLASFVKRRFGKEVLERIAQPMIAGIYTVDPEELSLEATFPHFLKMEQQYGSIIRALGKQKETAMSRASEPRSSLFLTLKRGMSSLISALVQKMPKVYFHKSTKVTQLEKKSGWKILPKNGSTLEVDALCLAIPAIAASKLVNDIDCNLSRDLDQIPYGTVATVNFALHRKDIGHPLNGLGYVVPAVETKEIVGCTFSSIKFAQRVQESEMVLIRAFVGGKNSKTLLESEDKQIVDIVYAELAKQLMISAKPFSALISRWSEAIPQYRVGHRQTVERIFATLKDLPGLYLTGNAYRGTGIPDCIQQASQTATQMLSEFNKHSASACTRPL